MNQALDQQLVGSRVRYTGYNFQIETTVRDIKTTKFGSIEVLLETDAGITMWRAWGDCQVLEAEQQTVPAIAVFDDVHVHDTDGNHYFGTVIGLNGTEVLIRTEGDEFITCQPSTITRIIPAVSPIGAVA
jgi:hypothetical protein